MAELSQRMQDDRSFLAYHPLRDTKRINRDQERERERAGGRQEEGGKAHNKGKMKP